MNEPSQNLEDLRREVVSVSEHNERLKSALREAKTQLEALRAEVRRIGQPPLSRAIFEGFVPAVINSPEGSVSPQLALVAWEGKHVSLATKDFPELASLQPGDAVWVDSLPAVVGKAENARTGAVATVSEIREDRAVVTLTSGTEMVLRLHPELSVSVKAGDTLLVDPKSGWALEILERAGVEQALQPEIPGVTYADIGGLDDEIHEIRTAVELPYTHHELFASYGMRAPKGVLLYGPPGCGKTMLAKAVAASLAVKYDQPSVFLSVKGPELLSKYVGETERQIRAIFDRARELAGGTHPVVVFFDEMESLFRTRGTGISSDVENMLVPQLLTEMDGLEELQDVIVIGASNREDMIDPALLRPGRFDVKIRVGRPDASAARSILAHQLHPATPFDTAEVAAAGNATIFAVNLVEAAVNHLFVPDEGTYLCTLNYRDLQGHKKERRVYFQDMISGALLVSIADKAKNLAIERELSGHGRGIRFQDLDAALADIVTQTAALTALLPPENLARDLGISGIVDGVVRDLGTVPHSGTRKD